MIYSLDYISFLILLTVKHNYLILSLTKSLKHVPLVVCPIDFKILSAYLAYLFLTEEGTSKTVNAENLERL